MIEEAAMEAPAEEWQSHEDGGVWESSPFACIISAHSCRGAFEDVESAAGGMPASQRARFVILRAFSRHPELMSPGSQEKTSPDQSPSEVSAMSAFQRSHTEAGAGSSSVVSTDASGEESSVVSWGASVDESAG
jgi:hypothetical protein